MPGRLYQGILAALICCQCAQAQDSLNVTLFGQFLPNPFRYSGSWCYVAPNGDEYAVLGGYTGTHVVAIGDSTDIHQAGFVAGPQSNWREVTVVGNHAFVVTEGAGAGAGMQVISLAPLPDSVHLVTTYTSALTRGHIIMRDVSSDSPYVYISGTSTTGGVHILNVSNPAAPVQVGLYHPAYYIHDAHIRGNRLYASAGGMRKVDIVDITNKANPVFLAHIPYPGSYTHSCWTTEDQRFLFVTDEEDGQVARIWNIENLTAIREVSQYSANRLSLVHNPYIRGPYAFIAHNTEGMRVVDIADPSVPVEVGYYDTFSGPSGGFNGLWSACPFLPSRKVLGGDRTRGLFIWRFNNTRAGRVYGIVSDSLTGLPIDSAYISFAGTARSTFSDSAGGFRLGTLPGGYSLSVSATGYLPKAIHGLAVTGGDSLWVPVLLRSTTNDVPPNDAQSREFALFENYPNPFNPTTRIRYGLPQQSSVRMTIYNVMGQEVVRLYEGEESAGFYALTWNGLNSAGATASSGVYFYRLEATGADRTHVVQSRKMILLK